MPVMQCDHHPRYPSLVFHHAWFPYGVTACRICFGNTLSSRVRLAIRRAIRWNPISKYIMEYVSKKRSTGGWSTEHPRSFLTPHAAP